MEMNYISICSALKKLRENAQLTQEELAQYFGCDEILIENWESGVTEPTISECLVLSKLYGIPLNDMFADFDVSSVIPETCRDSFEQKRRIHSAANRWYN